MENIWAFLEQTLAASLTAAVLLIAKRLFLDKLSPRWQYGVWAILAIRLLLPAGFFGRTLIPGLDVALEAAKTGAESSLSSVLTDPYGLTEVLAPIPLVRLAGPVSITDWLFYLYAAGVAVCLLRCLHWCNPLLWYCWDQAQNDSEALCDQRVLERLEGEERREYGVILLSMADNRYARAPGTTSMANGGKNIKHRIGAIARFKRYPQGVALGSWCVAVVLAAACLVGTSGAVEMPEQWAADSVSLARARMNRATTVAGALDTYAKAIMEDSPIYLMMAAPEEAQGELFAAAQARKGLDTPYPLELLGIEKEDGVQAEWAVYNLLEGADGNYTGLLVLDAYTTWFAHSTGDFQSVAVSQPVRIVREGNFWAVEPLEDWTAVDPECTLATHVNSVLPALTYTAQVEDFRVEINYQYLLQVDNRVQVDDTDFFGTYSSDRLDTVPKPAALFTDYYRSAGGRTWKGEEEISLTVWYEPLTREEAEAGEIPEQFGHRSVRTPEEHGLGGGGGSDSTGCDHQQSPAALAVRFQYRDQVYNGIAWPEEVAP
ncbi:M56 family metallopeptidase [Flavonifractor sp. AGMB03687]|uniref:M56 family metallopeptidase n=1 Tax=Flavonifractor sp. AGMB03687 TaxID=2785133 RepID=UPI001ADF6700|nr:M56 family metallopeptidase [Flavonifractor sp. AGMB03687]